MQYTVHCIDPLGPKWGVVWFVWDITQREWWVIHLRGSCSASAPESRKYAIWTVPCSLLQAQNGEPGTWCHTTDLAYVITQWERRFIMFPCHWSKRVIEERNVKFAFKCQICMHHFIPAFWPAYKHKVGLGWLSSKAVAECIHFKLTCLKNYILFWLHDTLRPHVPEDKCLPL